MNFHRPSSLAGRMGTILGRVQRGITLSREEAAAVLGEILVTETAAANSFWVALFAAIQARKAREEEVLGFVDAVLAYDPAILGHNKAKAPLVAGPVCSITGSGKDSWKTFNISTTASFAAAALGVTLFKPGSRALSSVTGASDLIRHLDLPELATAEQAGELLESERFAILDFSRCAPRYAPRYHGLFFQFHPLSYVMPSLAIPFEIDSLVYGIADTRTEFCRDLITSFGVPNVAVVSTSLDASHITDELIPFGTSSFSVQTGETCFSNTITNAVPEGLDQIAHRDTHAANAQTVLDVLGAKEATLAVKAAAMASAAIVVTARRAESLEAAYRESIRAILDGAAMNVLNRYRDKARGMTRRIYQGAEAGPNKAVVEKAQAAQKQISKIAQGFGYAPVIRQTALRGLTPGFLSARFEFSDALDRFDEVPTHEQAIVTGFGPTNAPTAGTLSVMLKVLGLHTRIGCQTEIIVSDLGAYLSRTKTWAEIEQMTTVFQRFLGNLTGGSDTVFVRSHVDKGNLGLASFVNEGLLTTQDFLDNKEATELLYDELGLLGSQFGIITDSTYTVCDILKPFFRPEIIASHNHGKRRVLVVAGIEEHYFPRLARIALDRLHQNYEGRFVSPDCAVSALYTKLIPGFAPYPKMSKSIPDSGLTLEDSAEEVYRKIVDASEANQPCVLEMMLQASGWPDEQLEEALTAFDRRHENAAGWRRMCLAYVEEFLRYGAAWSEAKFGDPAA